MKQSWPTELQVDVRQVDGLPCVRLSGEGEHEGAGRLEQALRELLDSGLHRVILDTRDVRFLDPTCRAVLEAAVRELEDEGGLLVVVDQSLPVERTLKLLGLEQLVHVVPNFSQAMAYVEWHE